MRAAGIPLIRIMRPVLLVVLLLTGISFYFQNFTAPKATMDLRTLLISMKQTQPAVEIPEGVFIVACPMSISSWRRKTQRRVYSTKSSSTKQTKALTVHKSCWPTLPAWP
ncbi:MAG: LptF/LptG family permease [Bacteroidales bacterium]|nr:LptF/LptG family permease [Candidatus Equimonas enterica]